jgi:hypothetical protein
MKTGKTTWAEIYKAALELEIIPKYASTAKKTH